MMGLRNTQENYGSLTIGLHWLMAAMILGLIIVGFLMELMGKGPNKDLLVNLHKATGLMVLIVGLFRWYWTISSQKTAHIQGLSKTEVGASHAVKWLLMLLLLAMPISGLLMSMFHGYGVNVYGLFEIPSLVSKNKTVGGLFGRIHGVGAYLISAIVVIHILAAIRHHFIKKDDTLKRMLGKK